MSDNAAGAVTADHVHAQGHQRNTGRCTVTCTSLCSRTAATILKCSCRRFRRALLLDCSGNFVIQNSATWKSTAVQMPLTAA